MTTRKRIRRLSQIREGAIYEIGGVKFNRGEDPKECDLWSIDPIGGLLTAATIIDLIDARIPITEIAPPPVPEHTEPKYVKYGVYADADMPMGGEWMYLPDDSYRGGGRRWLAMLSTSLNPWRTRDELPSNLRLVRSSTPVEDQS